MRTRIIAASAAIAAAFGFATACAHAATPPATFDGVRPISWPQFKQSWGTIATGNTAYSVSNPSSATVPSGTALAFDYLNLTGRPTNAYATDDGSELRGQLLGDYGATEPPNVGYKNHFLNDQNGAGLNPNDIASWVSPLYSISPTKYQQTALVTYDDLDNAVFAGPGWTNVADASAVNDEYDSSAGAGGNATWTFTAPETGYLTIWADIPGDIYASEIASGTFTPSITGSATYTITDNGATIPVVSPTIAQNESSGYIALGGGQMTAGDTIVVTLDAATGDGLPAIADAVQVRTVVNTVVDNLDPPATSAQFTSAGFAVPNPAIDTDYYGTDYLTAPAVARSGGATATATWTVPVTITGTYDVSVWFPSQSAVTTGGTTTEDNQVDDAEYTINIENGGTVYYTQTAIQSQKVGGQFVKIGGPFEIPAGYSVAVTLDNTTNDPLAPAGLPAPIVVADAMEITSNDGIVTSSPVVANSTDYPELFYGYCDPAVPYGTPPNYYPAGATVVGPTPINPGGGPAAYVTSSLNYQNDQVTGGTLEYHGPGNFFTPVPANPIPISQIVYFGRTENMQPNAQSNTAVVPVGPAQQSGALYAVDGLSGNVIWKYGQGSYTVDDTDPTFTENPAVTWTSETGPATNYIGTDYKTTPAINTGGGATATDNAATWQLPLVTGSGAASYFVYVHFPTPVAPENYITDATYNINAEPTAGSADAPVTVAGINQNTAGWTELSNPGSADGSFILDANNYVGLDNVTADVTTGANPPVVLADAVEFVPVSGTGTISSTPIIVRDMKVMTTSATGAHTYEPRDVVIFADNLGRVYCVDAAGNGDGNDTILDSNGNPVSFDASGNPITAAGVSIPPPYNFHIEKYGTTRVYWIWQPSSAAASVILHDSTINPGIPIGPGTSDGQETAPDANRDLPVPQAFALNSPTISLAATTDSAGNFCYGASVYIGNTNGVLYKLDAQGVVPDTATTENSDYRQYRLSNDETMPTVDVDWWFNTGAAISYAPAYDASTKNVYVTTYNPNGLGEGRLYAVNATTGPVGNDGKGPDAADPSGAFYPASYNYNINPVSYWSFPDAWGAVTDFAGAALSSTGDHLDNSGVNGGADPAISLGDMCGSPTVESIDAGGKGPQILVCANDPGLGGQGSLTNGRVYSINENGTYNWSFPSTGADPNTVSSNNVSQFDTVFDNSAQSLYIGAFTEQDPATGNYCSSSVATSLITFPDSQSNTSTSDYAPYADTQLPMAYVGTLDGNLLALNLNGGSDAGRFIYYDQITTFPIYSTPAVLPGSIASATTAGSDEVGGVVWIDDADENLFEVEAAPYAVNDPLTSSPYELVNTDWEYTGVGGESSPAVGSFDVSQYSGVNGTGTIAQFTSDSEWVYAGSNDGFCYGFTPNSSSGTGGFTPGNFIPPSAFAPPSGQVNLSSSLALQTDSGPPTGGTIAWTGASQYATPLDWGQTLYVDVFGIPYASGNNTTTGIHDLRVGASISPQPPPLSPASTLYTATGFPPANASGSLFPTGPSYVAQVTIPVTNKTPGTALPINGIMSYLDAAGQQHVVTAQSSPHYAANGSTAGTFTMPPPQPVVSVLNPLAISGAGRSADGTATYTIQELGPLGGVNTGTAFSVYRYADGNGDAVPNSQPAGGSDQNATVEPTAANGGNVGSQVYVVATGIGDVAHGSAGDNSNGTVTGDPTSSASESVSDPIGGSTVNYGQSLLMITDRSAEGSIGSSLWVHQQNTIGGLDWNDNSGQGGPGSVVNYLSWDAEPVSEGYGVDTSLDYPDIPSGDLSTDLLTRSTGGPSGSDGGQGAQIASGDARLAPSSQPAAGDPNGTRTVYPMSAVVKVAVPKYQPANLEQFAVATGSTDEPLPGTPISRAAADAANTPQGYIGTSNVYIDPNGGASEATPAAFNSSDAYRTIETWVGVPVDMSMSIDQPTIDIGSVPAGFGLQPGQSFAPYIPGAGRNPDASTASIYTDAGYFLPITVRNNGNVNLLNVHFDQYLAGPDVLSPGADLNQYLQLESDQVETPLAELLAGGAYVPLPPSQWTDSTSFIPSFDSPGGMLTGSVSGGSSPSDGYLIRTSIDPDIYTPNQNELDPNGQPPVTDGLYASLHKPRPGDASGTTLSIPDEPHDAANPDYQAPASPLLAQPMISVAVPYGTPVGDYYGTIRAFEGSDPYSATAGSGYSTGFGGPEYTNALTPPGADPYADGDAALSISNGSPQQYFTQPGTTLKVNVTENRFTDGPSLFSNGQDLALPNADAASHSVVSGSITLASNDVQPAAFRAFSVAGWSPANYAPFGLLFVSNRTSISAAGATAAAENGYDLFGSALAPAVNSGTQNALSLPTTASTWWTAPANLTTPTGTGSDSGSVRSPYVLEDGVDDPMAFWVTTATGSSGQTVYTVREADITNATAAGLSFNPAIMSGTVPNTATEIFSSTDPIYGVRAVVLEGDLLVFWHSSSRGRSAIYYAVVTMSGRTIDRGGAGTGPSPWPVHVMPVANFLTDVSSPSPVLRLICTYNGSFLPEDPDGTTVGNFVSLPSAVSGAGGGAANYVDVTYSGVSTGGATDIYTSRYALVNGALVRVPMTGAAAGSATPTLSVPLVQSPTDSSLYSSQDIDWAVDPALISIFVNGQEIIDNALVQIGGSTPQQHYVYDKASGQIVYTNVAGPGVGAATTTETVYVNPELGTVRFGSPLSDNVAVVTATVVPLTTRVTFDSQVNTEPVSFLDDALTYNTVGVYDQVHASREWFIYRKSGDLTGAPQGLRQTLYYDTRRLTVDLHALNPTTTSLQMTPDPNNANASYFNIANLTVEVSSDSAFGTAANVTDRVAIDPVKARLYFPSYMEGMYAKITYTDQSGTTYTLPAAGQTIQLEWQDEPYLNNPNASTTVVGERVVPMANATNESDPDAFLDPTAGYYNGEYVPHRVWLFWTSTRNAQPSGVSLSAGSDIYFEALDPKFSPTLPD